MPDSTGSGAGTAQAALDAVQRYPHEAIAIAQRVLAAGSAAGADERSTAERAVGLALRELNDLPGALRHLRRAVRAAGTPRTRALARMSQGYVLANAGHTAAALRAVTAALPQLVGADAGRARMQRGVVLHYRGRYDEAVRDYGLAVDIALREDDLLLEARARNNRGLLNAHRGAAGGTHDDLSRAAAAFQRLGLDLAAADARWNCGIAAGRRGDIAGALRCFATVDEEYRRLAVPRPALLLDRVELLLSVPLVDEAVVVATAAVRELGRRGMASDFAEALLARARAALLAADLDTATEAAAAARARFRRQGRRTWAVFARHVELRAEYRRGTRSAPLLTAMARTADQLDATGWPGPALTTRIEAGLVAAALGRPGRARNLLAVAARARRRGTADRRAQGWYALALSRRLGGDEPGAARALRRGLAVLDRHRMSLGATELRAHSGAYGQELAAEGLDIAVRAGAPARVLAWAERWRANALRARPARPPADPELVAALAELRLVSSLLEDEVLAGRPATALRGRQARLEQRIRDLARRVPGEGAVLAPPGVGALAARLGSRVLVELVAHGDRIRAVMVRDGRASLHDLGPLAAAADLARRHRFALRRLVTTGDTAAARTGAAHAAAALDRLLFAPLRLADRALVIVPVGALHAVPWSALPTCAGRPVTVAPSATAWLGADRRELPAGPPVLAAGPRLPAGHAEVCRLAQVLPGARRLTGPDATAAALTAALDGAGLVHIAAHGTFRADNPQFSSLELADGPLFAHEWEAVARPPGCVVLSACDSGLTGLRPGDEVMGFTAVLLALGTRCLIATVLPVPAEPTTALMLDLHARMRAGAGPAGALAEAQRAFGATGDGAARATAAAFVCFGAG
ncbi:CHAT domain-containing protein [Micromonospora sp. WMMD1128]|uniref:CHAT domain-containing protein n=1 Tax=Micromonospora sp. WMMD1128 TaxID=3015150 RepID=UPI00248AED81|nr:CHAT domain-containing protein [Micromonospora sp. WMMD1128]WBB75691.1 CHAT domain-containing protein [Micromonospora sp. WMMD1128]